MNPKARRALENMGVDSSGHEAQRLSAEDLEGTALILTMTREQAEEVLKRFPQAKGRVFPIADYAGDGRDVADPYGGDAASYKAAATEISDALDVFAGRVKAGATSAQP